ncbi:MAG TPA: pentapeptide repeat-containing protein [Tepidiformaceae bacterium]
MAGGAHSPSRLEWSEREREVLDLIARGRTNGEIAESLGVTFATAKWHVSELITKLGVASREDVADYWRRERSLRGRMGRVARGMIGLPMAKLAVGGATVVGLAAAGGIAWGAFADGPPQPALALAEVTAVPTPTPVPAQTPTPGPTPNIIGRPAGCPTSVGSPDRSNLVDLMLCPALRYPAVAAFDSGGCDLSGMAVTVADHFYFNYIDFRGCRLDGAAVDGQAMNSSSFEGVSARGASLRSSMASSVFRDADLAGADLSNAVIQGSDFTGANLLGADLTNAISRGAIWKNTICPDGTNSDANGGTCIGTLWVADYWPGSGPGGWVTPVCFPKGTFVPAGALCPYTAFPGFAGSDPAKCSAPGGDFHGGDLRLADLRGCDLSGANLAGADLEGAVLAGAKLAGADLTGAKLFKVDAAGADLTRARLDRAIISHTSFEGANLKGASVTMTLLRPRYGNTTCPDGSNSEAEDGDGRTCERNR